MYELLKKQSQYQNPKLATMFASSGITDEVTSAEGVWLINQNGERFMDLSSNYGVMGLGHSHPRVVQAAMTQLQQTAMGSHILANRPAMDLAQRLAEITPGDLHYSFFSNSGSEAVETAIKFALFATGRSKIVTTDGAYHGTTIGAEGVSHQEIGSQGSSPRIPDITSVRYGDFEAMIEAIDDQTAAVIVEPIQGEGGINVPPDGYLRLIRQLCDRHGALMIVDEVQTGLGRTGDLFAVNHEGVTPDLLCIAKALGGGIMPIGATIGNRRSWKALLQDPVCHGSTFGGSPLACATALEALAVIEDEQLVNRAQVMGDYFMQQLQSLWKKHHRVIKEVRGRGLMIGVELHNQFQLAEFITTLYQLKVVAVFSLHNSLVVRVMPPLIISQEEADWGLERIAQALEMVDRHPFRIGWRIAKNGMAWQKAKMFGSTTENE